MGFSIFVFSEDYSLVLLDKPATVSSGTFLAVFAFVFVSFFL